MRLAITRDENHISPGLKKQAEQLKVELVPLPFLSTNNLSFEIPQGLKIADVDWLVFTSANGVRGFFAWLGGQEEKLPYTTKIGAVGSKTAEAICSEGRTVDFIPNDSYGEQLFNELLSDQLKSGDVVLFARGREVAFDPASLFDGQPIQYYSIVTYETEVKTIDSSSIGMLEDNDFVLFTSPSNVTAYAKQFGQPVAHPVAIGNTTATRMKESGWDVYHTLGSANVDTVLESLQWN